MQPNPFRLSLLLAIAPWLAGLILAGAASASTTPVNVTSVTPSLTTIGNWSQYTIDFDVATDGGLTGTVDNIVVTFPSDTVVTNGALAGVTVEGTAATSAIGSSASRTVTIVPAQDLTGGTTAVTLVIPSTVLRNPTTVGSYTLTVSTSQQPAGSSPSYSIGTCGTAVTVVSATPNPATVGNLAAYTIDFNNCADGGLVGGVSTITVTFPAGTIVPNGSITYVTVEGIADVSSTGDSASRTIVIIPSQNIAPSTSNITILIPTTGTPVRNPLASGNYSLTVSTSVQTNAGASPSYAIGSSSTNVNIDYVSPTPATIGNPAQYNIQFDLASDGGLVGSASTITIVFPSDTVVPNGSITGVTVEGIAAASATGTAAARTIVVTPAQTNLIGGTTNINVVIPSAALRNPTSVSSYTLTVATNVQPAGTSPSYSIGLSSTSVAVTGVVPAPNTVGQQATYTIDFNTSADGALIGGTSTITVTFPSDTLVINGALSGINVEGVAAFSANGNSAARTVTIVPNQNISGSTSNITLSIPSTALRNPTTAANYTLTVATSVQPAGTSPNYTIGTSSTAINVQSVVPNPNLTSLPATYTIDFAISADGALVGGTSTITVTFPSNTAVLNGSLSGVTVEGTAAASATGNSAARTIVIVPSVNIPGGTTDITLYLPSTAVTNPTAAGNYTLSVATSVQPAGTSPSYSILAPTPTCTPTRTATPTATPTRTHSATFTATPTRTPTPTFTFTRTFTPTFTISPTSTVTPTFTISPTRTTTPTVTLTCTISPTVLATATSTATPILMNADEVKAYPAPAIGPDLWFAYAPTGPAQVKIEIFNVAGELCLTLRDECPAAGVWRTRWDIRAVAPGVYIYRLTLAYPAETRVFDFKKLIIIKR